MRYRIPALGLLVLLASICLGCRNDNALPRETVAERERQNRRYEQQINKGDELVRRVDKQYDRADEQAKRMNTLLDRWEEQADRYDKILDKWEGQPVPGKSN